MTQPIPEIPGLEVEHRYVQVRGVRFHVAEAGSGDPLVCIHGWPQHWWAWHKVLPRLAERHRVICPDLRGFGWSEAPAYGYDKREMATDMLAVLDALEIEKAALVGHDWGGFIGFLMAIREPERFSSYLALNIAPPWPDPPSPKGSLQIARFWYQAVIASPGLGRTALGRSKFVERLMTAANVQEDAWTERDIALFVESLRQPERIRASRLLYRTFLRREVSQMLRGSYLGDRDRLEVPTLLLFGTSDLAIDHRHLGPWAEHADRMALELREDSGHFIVEELPDLVADRALALAGGADPLEFASS